MHAVVTAAAVTAEAAAERWWTSVRGRDRCVIGAITAAVLTAELAAEDVRSTDWLRWWQRHCRSESAHWRQRQEKDCVDVRAPPATVDAVGRSIVVDKCDPTPDRFTRRLPTQTDAPSLPTASTPMERDRCMQWSRQRRREPRQRPNGDGRQFEGETDACGDRRGGSDATNNTRCSRTQHAVSLTECIVIGERRTTPQTPLPTPSMLHRPHTGLVHSVSNSVM